MAYARYGRYGKGLTDRAQRSYARAQTAKRIASIPAGRGIFQDLAAVAVAKQEYAQAFTSAGKLRGSYEALTPQVKSQIAFHEYARGAAIPKATPAGMGMITTGMGKPRMPFTAQKMTPAGGGASIGTVVGVGTLAYIAWKVLL